jgi:serine/threonine-protein kinase
MSGGAAFAAEAVEDADDLRARIQRRTTGDFKASGSATDISARDERSSGKLPFAVREGGTPPGRSTRVSAKLSDPRVTPAESRQRRNRAAFQTLAILGALLLVTIGLTLWGLSKIRSGGGAINSPSQAQPESLPSPPASTAPLTGQTFSVQAPEGMVYVPGGAFQMGRNGGDKFEAPVFSVTLAPFFIDRTEVTNEDYQKFIKATIRPAPANWPANWKDGNLPAGEAKLPVVNVTWEDASAYARWAGKRLPTEAEWEFAARGADGRIYPWGNDWNNNLANAGRGAQGRPVQVGSYLTGGSPFGALDMCGNVWEWTAGDLFSYADKSKALAPGKVIRGGAYDVPRGRATTTYRGVVPPDRTYDKTGFRCARDIK